MKFTLILTLLAGLGMTGLLGLPAQAQNRGDELILQMGQAFKKGDKTRLSNLLPQVRGHALEPLAAYWEMRARLDSAPESEIRGFLAAYAGS